MRARRSGAAAVIGRDRYRPEIDVVEASHIDRHHRRTVRRAAAAEGADAAGRAEEMVDAAMVELVVGKGIGPCSSSKSPAGTKASQWPRLPQIEQLHDIAASKAPRAVKRTRPQ